MNRKLEKFQITKSKLRLNWNLVLGFWNLQLELICFSFQSKLSSYENYDNRWFGIFYPVLGLFLYGGYAAGYTEF